MSRIVIDLDGTTMDYAKSTAKVVGNELRKIGVSDKIVCPDAFEMNNVFEALKENPKLINYYDVLADILINEEPYDGCIDVLSELKNSGMKIYVNTARPATDILRKLDGNIISYLKITVEQVDKWFGGIIEDIIMSENKAYVYRDLEAKVLIDDDPKYLNTCIQLGGINTLCYRHLYNSGYKYNYVTGWREDIKDKIMGII